MVRKKFSGDFKAKVAIEVMKNNATIAELAQKHGVHPTQIKTWEKTLLDKAGDIFAKNDISANAREDYIKALERKTGQLTIENDFLKKNLMKYPKKEDLK